MKRLLTFMSLCILAACSKTDRSSENNSSADQQTAVKESCDFGLTEFNLTKRAPVNEEVPKNPHGGGGSGGGSGGGGNPPPPPPNNPGVIFLDFDGHYVSGTNWNGGLPFTCAPGNMSSAAMLSIYERISNDYAPFNITVTLDEAAYNAANIYRRMRVVFTESWEWFGQAGGTAFLNSFTWGNNTPCFVFTSLLNYNEKAIAEAGAHEAGHTFGLKHQAVYNGTVLVNQYNYGAGSGEIGWAPIMGCAYYQNVSTWHNGPNSVSSTTFQNDVAIIASLVGYPADDYVNTTSGAAVLSTSLNGKLNSSTDIDFFSVNIASANTLTVIPKNVAPGNVGANTDLVIKIYNSSGSLINTVNDASILNASIPLNAGQYFISVAAAPNAYATSTYGMLGQYNISLN